jgi:type IV pilus assembly protein PilN
MIRINLLPYRAARKKENIRIQVNIFIGSIVILLLLVWVFNTFLNGHINRKRAEIASTKAQVEKYQKIMDEIAEIKKKLNLVDRKIRVIKSLQADRKAPVQDLDSLYHLLVDKRMWYTSLEQKNKQFRITGIALDNYTVAEYMTRLEKSERYNNVKLASVKKHGIEGQSLSLKKFEVNFNEVPQTNKSTKGEE